MCEKDGPKEIGAYKNTGNGNKCHIKKSKCFIFKKERLAISNLGYFLQDDISNILFIFEYFFQQQYKEIKMS